MNRVNKFESNLQSISDKQYLHVYVGFSSLLVETIRFDPI